MHATDDEPAGPPPRDITSGFWLTVILITVVLTAAAVANVVLTVLVLAAGRHACE